MSDINFTPFPVLITERLNLRQIVIEDMDEFFILKSDERLLKYYNAKPKTYEESRRKLLVLNDDIGKNESITWGITFKNENKLIGSICFWNISRNESKAEVGYELMVDWQGKGIMQEAIKAVIKYGFKDMRLSIIEAVPDPGNSKSVKLLERNNFLKGESFYETDPSDGKVLERSIYSLTNNYL
ncbi:putative ribosomal N-acetyltransferase YdaF [Oxobacter pfennigii]|uniref:Putative ribosomal N-acetyltransferase YdaF n=1 Tax=Oxobacter pfennigii TaxID=36849 RepID=A0A0P9AH81_9CLOT|nr:GNAT family N-acetyltransferase [Oxobacter pfennigii]KPU44814.1 putative ribosomal N-acetyltransferase YdaF [Oxobacter pfennigii]